MAPRQASAQLIAKLELEAKLAEQRSRAFAAGGFVISEHQEQGYCDGLWTAIRELENAINND